MGRDYLQDILEAEIQKNKRMLEGTTALLDPELTGTLNVRKEKGRELYYCNRGKGADPKKLYLGSERSPKYHKFILNKSLAEEGALIEKNLAALGGMVEGYKSNHLNIAKICEKSNDELLKKEPRLKMIKTWMEEPYQKNDQPFSGGEIILRDGTRMRSKDECMEYDIFKEMGLPFRYDSVMQLYDEEGKDVSLSPDFLFKCFDGSLIILEHLGLLGKQWYANNFTRKLQLYLINGFDINRNLFLTAGTKKGGINIQQIHEVAHRIETKIWQTF